jgi:hypothetical protein
MIADGFHHRFSGDDFIQDCARDAFFFGRIMHGSAPAFFGCVHCFSII